MSKKRSISKKRSTRKSRGKGQEDDEPEPIDYTEKDEDELLKLKSLEKQLEIIKEDELLEIVEVLERYYKDSKNEEIKDLLEKYRGVVKNLETSKKKII